MTDLIKRLLAIPGEDHVRGCEGRNYSCNCGRDETIDRIVVEAASEITRLRGEVERLRALIQSNIVDLEYAEAYANTGSPRKADLTAAVERNRAILAKLETAGG